MIGVITRKALLQLLAHRGQFYHGEEVRAPVPAPFLRINPNVLLRKPTGVVGRKALLQLLAHCCSCWRAGVSSATARRCDEHITPLQNNSNRAVTRAGRLARRPYAGCPPTPPSFVAEETHMSHLLSHSGASSNEGKP